MKTFPHLPFLRFVACLMLAALCVSAYGQVNPFTKANTTYLIDKTIDLKGATVKLPAGCTLNFQGGRITNGKLVCNETTFSGNPELLCDVSGMITNQDMYVKWFGAKGDNKTDDTRAIQRAVNALCGNTLVFDNSTSYYYVTRTIQLGQQFNRPNRIEMNFASDQGSAIRVDKSFASTAIFLLKDIKSGYTIDGLSIYGSASKKGVGIKMEGSCRDVRISNYFANGLHAAIQTDNGCYYNYLNNFHFYKCNYGIYITGGYPQGSFKIDSGKITGCEYGVYSDAQCNDVVLSGVTLEADKYKIYAKAGGLFFTMPYLGDESLCNIVVEGGQVNIDSPTSPIGASGTGAYKMEDTAMRYGAVVKGGSLTLTNATFDGNFSNNKGDGYYTSGASVSIQGGKVFTRNVRFTKYEQNPLEVKTNNGSIYLEKLTSHVPNGSFVTSPKLENSFKSKHYGDCASQYTLVDEPNGMGGKILRVTPPQKAARWGIRFPYHSVDTVGVKYVRLKVRYSRDYSATERARIEKKLNSSAVTVSGGDLLTKEAISRNDYCLSYPMNIAWYGYTPILPSSKYVQGFKKNMVYERVLPVKLTKTDGFIEFILSQDNGTVSSSKSDAAYLDCAVDIFYIALVDEEDGTLLGRF